MSQFIQSVRNLPCDNTQVRSAIYRGTVYSLAARAESRALKSLVLDAVHAEFGPEFRTVHRWLDPDALKQSIKTLKTLVYASSKISDACQNLLIAMGFDEDAFFDSPRLRVVSPCPEADPELLKTACYAAHRDTWYANSQSQINFWISLHDCDGSDTFSFFPTYFETAIENDSHKFNFFEWNRTVGFGNSQFTSNCFYPMPKMGRPSDDQAIGFSSRSGDVLIFSASHLHGSNFNASEFTRFSIDFRYVNRKDEAKGLGAPNADNRSTGSATSQYFRLRSLACAR